MNRTIKIVCAVLIPVGLAAGVTLNSGYAETDPEPTGCAGNEVAADGNQCVQPIPSLLDDFGFGVGAMNDDPFAELSPIIKAAEYPGGTPVLVAYLKHESSALIENSSGNPLESGRVYFMVDASGNVSDAMIDSSCGYPKIDEKMLELINALPERFDPAQDGNGTTMVQELCFYYGMIGC